MIGERLMTDVIKINPRHQTAAIFATVTVHAVQSNNQLRK